MNETSAEDVELTLELDVFLIRLSRLQKPLTINPGQTGIVQPDMVLTIRPFLFYRHPELQPDPGKAKNMRYF